MYISHRIVILLIAGIPVSLLWDRPLTSALVSAIASAAVGLTALNVGAEESRHLRRVFFPLVILLTIPALWILIQTISFPGSHLAHPIWSSAAAALNERKFRPDSFIFCENGLWNYGGTPLHDHRAFGDLCVKDVLVKSSNIGAAKLALSVGDEKFYEYIRRFGFGERTGIELPGEISGLVRAPRSWSRISITRIPMGHEIGVTPLQMTVAMAAIANGGKLVMPRIVKSIVSDDGRVISSLSPIVVRQVISPQTARQIGDALRGVVSDRGTAAAAAIPGFTIAGKTGTAQKVDPKGGYEHGKYVVSFLGYLPADRPEFVGLVVLDDAHTSKPELNYGGLVAGPIFARIAEKAARYLDLEPHEEIRRAIPVERVALTNASHR